MQPMSLNIPVTQVAPPASVGGAARKEPLYDTSVLASDTAVGDIEVFVNFSSFNDAPATVTATKKRGRDTNLRGAGGAGLPARTIFWWYEGRLKVRPLGIDLTDATYKDVGAEVHRYLMIASIEYLFQNNPLVECQADELPSGVGPAWGGSTHTDHLQLPWGNCTPDRQGKHFSLGGQPIPIDQQQDFSVKVKVHGEMTFTPSTDLFVTPVYEGVLVRPITP